MRRFFCGVVGLVLAGCGGSETPETFHALLTTAQEVPAPTLGSATPSGTAAFVNNGGTSVSYTVNAAGLTSALRTTGAGAMHIHLGAPGAAAGVTVPLVVAAGATAGTATAAATFTAANITDATKTMADVIAAMRNGGAYINIHTLNNTGGEIRGQILTGGLP